MSSKLASQLEARCLRALGVRPANRDRKVDIPDGPLSILVWRSGPTQVLAERWRLVATVSFSRPHRSHTATQTAPTSSPMNTLIRRVALAVLFTATVADFAPAQALPVLTSLYVGYNTRKNQLKPQGELKARLDTIELALAV